MKRFKRIASIMIAVAMLIGAVGSLSASVLEASAKNVVITINANGGKITKTYEYAEGTVSGGGKSFKISLPYGASLYSCVYNIKAQKGSVPMTGIAVSPKKQELTASEFSNYRAVKNKTFYIVYGTNAKKKVQVTLNANGGKFSDKSKTKKINVAKGSGIFDVTYLMDSPDKSNNNFAGWSTDKKKLKHPKAINKKTTLYASWSGTRTVTFSSEYKTEMYVKKGSSLTNVPSAPEQQGKAFMGWSKTKDGSVINPFTLKVNKNMTLYPIYKSLGNKKSIRVEMTDYNYSYAGGKAVKPKFKVLDNYGSTVPSSGYTVSFYNNKKQGEASFIVKAKGEYLGWSAASYYISYDKKASLKSAANIKGQKISMKWGKAKYSKLYFVRGFNPDTGKGFFASTAKTSVTSGKLSKGTYYVYVEPSIKDASGSYMTGLESALKKVKVSK